ncbi:MAG: hypothetical protein LLF99_07755 [Desulfobacteraceae bacterium]|nr:hypothetical protein [Desulfobacteraceae bacterium]
MRTMKPGISSLRARLYLAAFAVLFAGLGSSAVIYWTAGADSQDNLVYQYENSKIYRHNVELIGGKVNVLADSLFNWFDGLWRGRSLALTVACLALVVSFGLFLAAFYAHPCPDDDPE